MTTPKDRAAARRLEAAARAQAYERARNAPVRPLTATSPGHHLEVRTADDGSVRIRCIRFTRPLLENAYHGAHVHQQAKLRVDWRTAFHRMADGRIPGMDWCGITVIPHVKDRRAQDIGACFPSEKAARDGLVDAGLVPDDGPEFVRALTFRPVVLQSPLGDAFELRITGWRSTDCVCHPVEQMLDGLENDPKKALN